MAFCRMVRAILCLFNARINFVGANYLQHLPRLGPQVVFSANHHGRVAAGIAGTELKTFDCA